MFALHEVEHSVERDPGGLAELRIEAECQPGARRPGNRPLQLEVVAEIERELSRSRTLDRGAAHLAVCLKGVPVTCGEERAVNWDGKEKRRPGDKLLAVDVPSPRAGRERRMLAGFGRGHSHHSEEGAQLDLDPVRPSRPPVELPHDHVLLRRARDGDAPRAGDDLVHADRERLPRACASDLDRAGESMPEPFELLARPHRPIELEVPPGIGDIDAHGVPRIDAQHRLEVARELALQVGPLERDLVDHRMRSPSTS